MKITIQKPVFGAPWCDRWVRKDGVIIGSMNPIPYDYRYSYTGINGLKLIAFSQNNLKDQLVEYYE